MDKSPRVFLRDQQPECCSWELGEKSKSMRLLLDEERSTRSLVTGTSTGCFGRVHLPIALLRSTSKRREALVVPQSSQTSET